MSDRVPPEISVDNARDRILAVFSVLPSENTAIDEALGRVAADGISAPVDSPAFTNSAMDGYALRASDIDGASLSSVHIPVEAEVPAGSGESVRLTPGACARIMTGAPLPAGADAVVPFELTTPHDDGRVSINAAVHAGANVRPAGEDFRIGEMLIDVGTRLGPAEIALLASVGLRSLAIRRRPRVAILATGDELVEPGAPRRSGQIWNANSPMLAALVRSLDAEPVMFGIAGDASDALSAWFDRARASEIDLLITTGGVSAGDFDLVKQVMRARGTFDEWRLRMRPGRPLAFGSIGALPVLGLPGNPVAAFVAFVQFARPAILKMQGALPSDWLPPELPVIVRDGIENSGGRKTFARVSVTRCAEGHEARLAGPQGSANLLTLSRANGLLVIPEDVERVQPGMRLTAQMPGWTFDML